MQTSSQKQPNWERMSGLWHTGDHFADDSDKSKYNLLRLKTLKEYNKLPSSDKAKALIFRKKAEEDGDYLGDKLDKNRCDSIRKVLLLKYK